MSQIIYIAPLLIVQAYCLMQGLRHPVFKSRQWRFFNGQAEMRQGLLESPWHKVEVRAHQVWGFIVILKYRPIVVEESALNNESSNWQWDVILKDACHTEYFRQLRALMRTEYLRG